MRAIFPCYGVILLDYDECQSRYVATDENEKMKIIESGSYLLHLKSDNQVGVGLSSM